MMPLDSYDEWQNYIPISRHHAPTAYHLRLSNTPTDDSRRTSNFGSTEHPFDDLQPPPPIRLRPRTPAFDLHPSRATGRMATHRRAMKRPPPSSPLVRYSYTYEDVILDQSADDDDEGFESEVPSWDSEKLHSFRTSYRSTALLNPFPGPNLPLYRSHHPLRRSDSFLGTKKMDFIEEEQEEEDDDVSGCSFFGRCTKLGNVWRSTPSSTPNMLLQLGCYTAKNLPVSIP